MTETEGVKNPLGSIPKEKRMYVYMGCGAAVIVGYAWWRQRATASAASEAAMDSAYSDDGYVTQASPGDSFWGSGGGGTSSSSDTSSTDTSGLPVLATNAAWMQYAVEQLAAAGTDPVAAQSALGKYLDRQALTSSEQDIVRRAIGLANPPPVGTFVVTPAIEAPAPSALAAPTGLKVTAVAPTYVEVTWNKVTGAGNYRLYRSGASQNVAASTDTVARVEGLEPGKNYTIYVAAGQVGSEAVGPRSAGLSVTTAKAVLKAPSTPKASQITSSSVYLTWGTVAGAEHYRIYQGTSGEPVGDSLDGKFRVSGLKSKTTYKYRVAAMSGSTTGPYSGYVTVKTK
ncbi:Fibronectin type III domain-containing protein [Streptomyces sp. 3213]|uniref:fibronectin type III domain-containing protein n=1 Tax=Streptomyces sp. 3213.3 TaxID=1855348 RepID=UPI00089D0D4F|nr:fibronectin type III domain-containing protein [Streptomyces sp. 3213.3]SEF12892.1 Fibronectin type III domain-containing protein [Streptomyces sp. 3213] [Streptomyces sp. 3213.3]